MKIQYCYSFNEEDFEGGFDSAEDALEEAKENRDDRTKVWIGNAIQSTAQRFMPSIDWVIDHMKEQAYDQGGEHADGYLDDYTSQIAKEHGKAMDAELDAAITAIFEKRGIDIQPRFFMVENVKLHIFED